MESKRKVVIVGTGMVGTTFAYTLMQSGLAGETVRRVPGGEKVGHIIRS